MSVFDALTTDDYKRALCSLAPLAKHEIALLLAHYDAPDHITTARELSTALGYRNYGGANLHYGQLARKICDFFCVSPPTKLSAIATFYKPNDNAREEWHFEMRPQLVDALAELDWFGRSKELDTGESIEAIPTDNDIADITQDFHGGSGFGETATNKTVEEAAVTFVTDVYHGDGWLVTSVEQKRCGYDLRCTKGAEEVHVEVKGLSGDFGPFIITAGEVNRAGLDPMFVLCVVARATSLHPELHTYTHSEFVESFELRPIQFRAVPSD